MSDAIELLKKLEWSGTTTGPGVYMGDRNGTVYKSCPICHGLMPGQGAGGDFVGAAMGHRKNCELSRLVKSGS